MVKSKLFKTPSVPGSPGIGFLLSGDMVVSSLTDLLHCGPSPVSPGDIWTASTQMRIVEQGKSDGSCLEKHSQT